MSTTTHDLHATYSASRRASLGAGLVAKVRATLQEWHLRATLRPRLAGLSNHLLRDMGMTRAEAEHEAAKPFWQG